MKTILLLLVWLLSLGAARAGYLYPSKQAAPAPGPSTPSPAAPAPSASGAALALVEESHKFGLNVFAKAGEVAAVAVAATQTLADRDALNAVWKDTVVRPYPWADWLGKWGGIALLGVAILGGALAVWADYMGPGLR